MTSSPDLLVIGAGSGGVRAARIAAGYGARVMIAEEDRVGGTCVIRGCVPKKLLVYASRFAHEFEDAAGFGWQVSDRRFDWPLLIAAKNRETARLEGAYRSTLEKAGVQIVASRAVLEDASTVVLQATGERIAPKHILIAVGGRPFIPPELAGADLAITSNEALDLAALPSHIVIYGGGYISVEFACIFAGLGSEVSVVYRGGQILRGFDSAIRSHVQDEMAARGIRILTDTKILSISAHGPQRAVALSDGQTLLCDQVMLASGRVPYLDGLGLEAAGVRLTSQGAIEVDAFSRTSQPHIYAVGDVTNRVSLTPAAIREGHAFADSVFGGRATPVVHDKIPTAVFCDPEVGVVGLSEEQARAQGLDIEIYQTRFRPMKHTLGGRDTRALMKLVVERGSQRVLGCHLAHEGAGELIQILGVCVQAGLTKADFDRTLAVHPTAAEELVTLRTPVS